MNQQFRNQCLDAIVKFETSFKEMNLPQQQYFQAYSLVSKIVSEIRWCCICSIFQIFL